MLMSCEKEKASVAKSGKNTVEKPKPTFQPMRYKTTLPDGFVAKQKSVKMVALENYLQVFISACCEVIGVRMSTLKCHFVTQDFDSDDEEKDPALASKGSMPSIGRKAVVKTVALQEHGDLPSSSAGAPVTKPLQKSRSMPVGSGVAAILSRRDPIRDRPMSAQKFREISANDSEMKVLYRYSNFRRMPLTEEQEHWLNNRENQRIADMKNDLKKVAADIAAAKAKKDKKGKKKDEKKSTKKKPPEKPVPPPKIIKKYSSANDFMDTHFPNFDIDSNEDAIGPMRAEQLAECEVVYHYLSEFNVSEKTVRNALLIPQDRPEAICLENTKNPIEGLMTNPLPKEYWRKMVIVGKKKKKGGGKKKKK